MSLRSSLLENILSLFIAIVGVTLIFKFFPYFIIFAMKSFLIFRAGGEEKYETMNQAVIEGIAIIESDLNMSCTDPQRDGLYGRQYLTCTNATTNQIVDVYPTWGNKKIPGKDRFENVFAFDTLCYYTTTGGAGRVVGECM